tara:strand:+ start:111 stop:254 length:144 start_codon:yes stop_codon:yes gene_type:complete
LHLSGDTDGAKEAYQQASRIALEMSDFAKRELRDALNRADEELSQLR